MDSLSRAKTFLVACGETSGERNAAHLVRSLKALSPGCRIIAMGSSELASAGAEIRFPLERFAFMGFAEVISHLPAIRSLERQCGALFDGREIDCFIPVDYPGLNMRLARRARRAGVPVLYFVGPQVWAWGAWRLAELRRSVDCMAVILPFEVEIYRRAGVPVLFAGHPLLAEIASPAAPKEAPRSGASPRLVLFPGSRVQEFIRMFPVLIGAARLVRERFPGARITVGLAPLIPDEAAAVPEDLRGAVTLSRRGIGELAEASLVLASSGTITLQTAMSGTPMVVIYRTSPMSYLLGRLLVRIPRIAMPNVLAGERLVPELIQGEATPSRVAAEAVSILSDAERYRTMSGRLIALRASLAREGGVRRAAEAALALAGGAGISGIALD